MLVLQRQEEKQACMSLAGLLHIIMLFKSQKSV